MSDVLSQVALVFLVNEKREVLLYRRLNTWYEEGKLALVGGIVDAGEPPIEAAVREVFEETSLVTETKDLTLLTEKIDGKYQIHYYVCKNWVGTPSNMEPDRCSELVWHPLSNLPEDTIDIIKTLATTI